MGKRATITTFECDWTDENGDVCGDHVNINGAENTNDAWDSARESGWGSYTNAYVRRDRWATGAKLIFCPVHATVFGNNHGWGGLEGYEPPSPWWKKFYRGRRS